MDPAVCSNYWHELTVVVLKLCLSFFVTDFLTQEKVYFQNEVNHVCFSGNLDIDAAYLICITLSGAI